MKTKLFCFFFSASNNNPYLPFRELLQPGSKLLSSGAVGAPQRGTSVSLMGYGNGALVGGPTDNGSTGAMWFYIRTNGVWSQYGTKIVPSEAHANSNFGMSVGISSDGQIGRAS